MLASLRFLYYIYHRKKNTCKYLDTCLNQKTKINQLTG